MRERARARARRARDRERERERERERPCSSNDRHIAKECNSRGPAGWDLRPTATAVVRQSVAGASPDEMQQGEKGRCVFMSVIRCERTHSIGEHILQ